jgi:hypothetical protein
LLFLCFWVTRVASLDAVPLHNDEGLHLTRAVEVWRGHPFWEISDGKIVNHWLIAAFDPRSAPVFVGRYATVLVSMVGLAAGVSLARRLWGGDAALFACAMWFASPYLFFFERLALADAQAGALVVLTLWACIRLAERGRHRDAVLTGLFLALAALFKLTAAPYALMVLLVVALMGRVSWRRRVVNLLTVGVVVAACFAVPLGYLALKGQDFGVALGWVGGGGNASIFEQFAANLEHFAVWLWQFGGLWGIVALAMLVGLALLAKMAKDGFKLIVAVLAPLGAIMALGTEALPRHYAVALPVLCVLVGGGLECLDDWWHNAALGQWVRSVIVALFILWVFNFGLYGDFYVSNVRDGFPAAVWSQYFTDHSAGFGLREAVRALPETVEPPDAPVIASMFPDSCRRANFYAAPGFDMTCTGAPGVDAITAALAEHGTVYVLVEAAGVIGVDVDTLDGVIATRIAGYPRPGECELPDDPLRPDHPNASSVVLWRLEAKQQE